ncbi:family 43 glycosylhydrolase [Paenarthrobacter sp. NPDC089989]|uniref:family 43 glycosylhydrolase n=1 Tax=unclassified Paenarthrobacter TaxID=2634190 RepID=UPI0037FD0515
MTNDSIKPGQPWLDTNGNRIQAHGGSMLYEDGTFYWYGENKERTTPGSGIWHWGVRAYSSVDLYNWKDEGLIIPPVEDDPSSPLHPARFMDRPHIIYNSSTRKYVCWIKIMEADGSQRSTILTADSFLGPYEIVNSAYRPAGMNAGDFDLVVEPSDGKAYYYFERVHSELICADLTEDYTAVTGYYSTHFHRGAPPFVREAPAHFKRGSTHYLVTSGTTGYFPNPSEVASAPSYHGPWTVLGDPHPDDPSETSFRSQISCVFKHPGKNDLYIAMADRWYPDLSPEESDARGMFERQFAGNPLPDDVPEDLGAADTSRADYVWLPFTFEGDLPVLRWADEWRIDDFA